MRRYTAYMSGERFMADSRTKVVHDLEKEKSQCNIDEIVRAGRELPFRNLNTAVEEGYVNCKFCIEASKKNLKLFGVKEENFKRS